MKYKGLYYFVLCVVVSFIILFSSDFLGPNNPIHIACEQIADVVYNRGK